MGKPQTIQWLKDRWGLSLDYNFLKPEFQRGFKTPERDFAVGDVSALGRKLSSLAAAGTSFGGTGANVEAILSGGSSDIAADTLQAGDVVRMRIVINTATTVSTDTFRLRIRQNSVSGTAIYDSTAVDVANGNYFIVDLEITIRTAGATGTGYVTGTVTSLVGSTAAVAAITPAALTGINTTAALKLAVATGVWSTENANVAAVQQFNQFLN